MPTDPPPGVYVEEVRRGPRPIEAVGTSTAVFFGVAPNADAALRHPTSIVSNFGFQQTYFGAGPGTSVLATAVAGFFANGGTRSHVVNLGANATSLAPADLQLLDALDDVNIVAAPGFTDAASHEAMLTHCEQRGDRFAILDTPKVITPVTRLTRLRGSDGRRARGPAIFLGLCPRLSMRPGS